MFRQEVTATSWTCRSQSTKSNVKDTKYTVSQLKPECESEMCHLKCPYMDCRSLCRHMYTCECVDYANGHICKHIHGLHSSRLKSQNTPTSTSDDGTSGIISQYFNDINCLCTNLYIYNIIHNVGMETCDDSETLVVIPDTPETSQPKRIVLRL